MKDKNIFDLLKEKMADLRPTALHRKDDWAALGDRLNTALPQQPGKPQRRSIALPLLFAIGLLSTNAVWWHSSNKDHAAINRLEGQVADLHAMATATIRPLQSKTQHDTIWKTVYIRVKEEAHAPIATYAARPTVPQVAGPHADVLPAQAANKNPIDLEQNAKSFAPGTEILEALVPRTNANSVYNMPEIKPLTPRSIKALALPKRIIDLRKPFPVNAVESEKPVEVLTSKVVKTLRPSFFKVGASAGWLNATSDQLMHEGGFTCLLQGEIGLSRHWSVTAEMGMASIHYKSKDPGAILGAPALPTLPSPAHQYIDMEVTGQRIRQFDIGLRYSFAQPGKPRPFLGLHWGAQTLKPFTIRYETLYEPSGTIQKNTFNVTTPIRLKNIIGLSAGFDIPITRRLNFIIEGFYQRQWNKPLSQSPDFTGIHAGLNWLF